MEITPILERFFRRRQELLDRLNSTGEKLTGWYDALRETQPTFRDLATLEGMLAERRNLLEQLMKLDDDMLESLIEARSKRTSDPTTV